MTPSPRELQDRIDEADRLVKDGRTAEARIALDEVCRAAPDDERLLSDVIAILMLARLYDEAEQVHTAFAERNGRPLRADFSLEHIRAERIESQNPKLTFRRLSIFERGHLPNKLRLWPVREISIGDAALTVRTARGTAELPWPALSATIEEEQRFKSYGRAAGGRMIGRTLTLTAGQQTYRVDVSDQFPDLERTPRLLAELAKRTDVRVSKK